MNLVEWPGRHTCRPSNNPRMHGRCACGKEIPPAPQPVRRVLQLEREFTEEAARGYVDPEALITHSETRSKALCGEYVDDPMEILPGRDLWREARCELADTRNYAVFILQDPEASEEEKERAFLLLRHVALAYDQCW